MGGSQARWISSLPPSRIGIEPSACRAYTSSASGECQASPSRISDTARRSSRSTASYSPAAASSGTSARARIRAASSVSGSGCGASCSLPNALTAAATSAWRGLEERGDGVDVGSHGNFGSRFSVNAWYPSM